MNAHNWLVWGVAPLLWIIAGFDLVVGYKFFADSYDFLKDSKGDVLVYMFAIGGVVQICMGFVLVLATLLKSERLCCCYCKVTCFALFISFPFVFRVLEMLLVLVYIGMLRELAEYKKQSINEIGSEEMGNLEWSQSHSSLFIEGNTFSEAEARQCSGDYTGLFCFPFMEQNRPNSQITAYLPSNPTSRHFVQDNRLQETHVSDIQMTQCTQNDTAMQTEQPSFSSLSRSRSTSPPHYSVCSSGFASVRNKSLEKNPPPYETAIKIETNI